jgi:dienelactone hydrolase
MNVRSSSVPALLFLIALLSLEGPAPAQTPEQAPAQAVSDETAGTADAPGLPEEILPGEWLVLAPVDGRGRRPFRPDAVMRRYIIDPEAAAPRAGEEVTGETGTHAWEPLVPNDKGRLAGQAIGYAYTEVTSPEERVMMAQLNGAETLFVDGVPYTGDYYNYGWKGVPVRLAPGTNRVFITGIRSSVHLHFWEPPASLVIGTWDCTIPDLVRGDTEDPLAGVLVLNASLDTHFLAASSAPAPDRRDEEEYITDFFILPVRPLQSRRVRVPIDADWVSDADVAAVSIEVSDRNFGTADRDTLDPATHVFQIPVRDPGELHRRTFVSSIDDSVQEYCVKPPAGEREPGDPMRLLLSVHGAGVQAWGQAACYPALPDFWHVAATNRRPFGFDWQDWGRTDAYEVLEHALELSGVHRRRVCLGGHSMGGHGVWTLAANDPDGFAALAPSAGWCSFDSYVGRPEGELRELWHAADATSSTEKLIDNLLKIPTYILHSDADESVPVREAYAMYEMLIERGAKPRMHIEPGKGHWWDSKIGPGTDCLAWPGFYEMFRESEIPRVPREIDFTTVAPVVDSEHFWVSVNQAMVYGERLRVQGTWTPESRRIDLETANVRHLEVRAPGWNGIETVVLDGQEISVVREEESWLFRTDGSTWTAADVVPASEKNPQRSGPFKRAIDNHFVFVVPTAGSEIENARAYESARYHASVWQYRGNGDVLIWTDKFLSPKSKPYDDINLILFGNRDTNLVWSEVLAEDSPIDVARGAITVGEAHFEGDDLGAIFVYPRKGVDGALVGAFASTGPAADRLTPTLAPFIAGVGYPDYSVYSSEVLVSGDGGVLAAGWFDAEWKLQAEGSVRRE